MGEMEGQAITFKGTHPSVSSSSQVSISRSSCSKQCYNMSYSQSYRLLMQYLVFFLLVQIFRRNGQRKMTCKRKLQTMENREGLQTRTCQRLRETGTEEMMWLSKNLGICSMILITNFWVPKHENLISTGPPLQFQSFGEEGPSPCLSAARAHSQQTLTLSGSGDAYSLPLSCSIAKVFFFHLQVTTN